jgi:indole-3-glycerol phosphate synthase
VILDRILEHKKAEIRHKNSRGYLAELKTKIRDAGPTLGFAVNLDARTNTDQARADRGGQEGLTELGPVAARV